MFLAHSLHGGCQGKHSVLRRRGCMVSSSSESCYLCLCPESLLPGPSISVTPQEGAILGTSATVHCMCQCHQTVMLLYKSGNVSIQQRAWPVRGMATFIITQVAQEDGGAYACRYGNESDPSSLSQLSPFAELLVRGESVKYSCDTMLGSGICRHIKGCPQSLSCWKHSDFGLGTSPNSMERMFCPRAAWGGQRMRKWL